MFSPISRLVQAVLVCCLLIAVFAGTARAQAFSTHLTYNSGGENPNSGAIGDFNGDNKPDIALANVLHANLSVLLNKGDGTFHTAVNYSADRNPESIVTADFNGDGKLDLVTGNFFGGLFSTGNISVLLGNGNGTFQPAVPFEVGSPVQMAVADLNGDSKLDLVTASWLGNKASVLLGNGNGTFQAAVTYSVGSEPRGVAIADFNGDTKLDLAVTNGQSANTSILLGNGNGTFQAATNVTTEAIPTAIVARDISGDGKQDLIIATTGSHAILVLIGNGNGTFQNGVPYQVGQEPTGLVLADFNGDGPADVITVNASGASYSLLRGNANGTFQTAVSPQARTGSWVPITGDFNTDGKPDLGIINNVFDLIDVSLNSPSAAGVNFVATQGIAATAPVATFIDHDATKTAASFTATINWGDGTPVSAGTVAAISGGFSVSGTHTYAAPGSYVTTIQIADDSGNFESATGTATVKALTTTAVTTSVTPSDFGQSVTFTATVTSAAGTPGGSVQFKDGGVNLGAAATLNAGGVATLTTSALATGTHTITAEYAGSSTFAASTGTLTGGQVVRPLPTVSVNDATIAEGDSGSKTLTFTATLSAASNLTATVAFATASSSATGGVDYQNASGTITFNPGETSKTTSVTIVGDFENEFDESFAVNLSTPVNAALFDSVGVGTIVNDDAPLLLLDDTTGRALALDSVNFTRDPFSLLNEFNLNPADRRRRIALFVWRLGLLPSDTVANLTVTAEDNAGGVYTLTVEHLSEFTDPTGLVQVVVRLPDNVVGAPRDLFLKVQLRGPASSSAVIQISGP